MSYFNSKAYDPLDISYNVSFCTYIEGTTNHVPISGTTYYNGKFPDVMCAFAVDGGDTVLGGNVLISNQLSLYDTLNLGGDISANGIPISPTEISYLSGATSNIQTQITAKAAMGPTGSTGGVGATGPAGPMGPAGSAGSTGSVGATGPAGPAGSGTGSGARGSDGVGNQAGGSGIVIISYQNDILNIKKIGTIANF